MEKINYILQRKKIIHRNQILCPRCKEDNAYTYFDFEQKINKWRCTTCGKEDFLMNLRRCG